MKKRILRVNIILFIIYIICLLYLTLFRNYLGRTEGVYQMNLSIFANIIGITKGFLNKELTLRFFLRNIFGNIIAFAPFAYFFITIFDLKDTKKFIFLVSGIIVIIESMQYILQIGVYDIDDIILNLSGATLAFVTLKDLIKKFKLTS